MRDRFDVENGDIKQLEANLFREYNLFYIHIPKTGGNTVLRTLRKEVGEDISEDIDNENLIRRFGAENKRAHTTTDELFTSHLKMTKGFKNTLDDNIMVFSTVRNPFDRAYSLYMWSKYGIDKNIFKTSEYNKFFMRISTFEQFLEDSQKVNYPLFEMCKPQSDWLYDSTGQKLFDIACKLENLREDMSTVCQHAGIKIRSNMFKYKINMNPLRGNLHYHDAYNMTTKNMVQEIYKKDLENFNYDF